MIEIIDSEEKCTCRHPECTDCNPPRKKLRGGKPGKSYPNRLLTALAQIFEDSDASVPERLQAMELAAKVLPLRPVYKRKTDKDKAIIAALERGNKKEQKETPS